MPIGVWRPLGNDNNNNYNNSIEANNNNNSNNNNNNQMMMMIIIIIMIIIIASLIKYLIKSTVWAYCAIKIFEYTKIQQMVSKDVWKQSKIL